MRERRASCSYSIRFAGGLGISVLIMLLWLAGDAPLARADGPRTLPSLAVWVEPAETVLGPDQRTDNPFHTLGVAPNLLAYVANGQTYGFATTNLQTLDPLPAPVLGPGPAGQFDSCGAWLNSAWRDGPLVRGWYHAETDCTYPATRKSVAYAESTDGGRTFSKPDYPANRVITAPPRYVDPTEASEGDHTVLQVGNYLYLYFIAARDFQVRVARSALADGGRPGTWYKYYNGAFSEAGLGGESSPIAPDLLARSWVAAYTPAAALLGFSYYPTGFGLALSADGITGWQRATDVVLWSEGEYWNRGPDSKELLEYPSVIGLDGEAARLGPYFWLYYMQLKPGETFADGRYLVRRRVYTAPAAGTNSLDRLPRIALSRYQSTSTPDTWVTTTNPPATYQQVATLGYLFTVQPDVQALPLYDCYLTQEADHMVDIQADCGAPGNPQVRNLRLLGWLPSAPFPGARRVYRCFDPATFNHFVSTDAACEGRQTEWPIGYLAPPPTVFADVPPDAVYYTSTRCLASRGILQGYACGGAGEPCDPLSTPYYRPGASVTRGQLAKIVASAAAISDPIPEDRQTFADVPVGQPFRLWIEQLAGRGVISGYSCGGPGEPCDALQRPYFRPGSPATRGHISKIIANAAGIQDAIPGGQQTFSDVTPGNPLWLWIERLAGRGIISGYGCGGPGEPCDALHRPYLRFSQPTTRGQLAKMAGNTFYPDCHLPDPVH